MRLITILSLLPGPVLRALVPHVRLADIRHSIESLIVEAWLHEPTENRTILVVGSDPLLHLPLTRNGATLVGLATEPKIVEDAHRLARRMGVADRVHFHVSDLMHLPFPAAYFDAVLCGSALARSTDELFILREMVRVLKSGGVLGLTLPSFEAAGLLSRYLPKSWLVDDLRREVVSASGGPVPQGSIASCVQQFMRDREQLRRMYRFSQMSTRLDLLGLEIADHGPYLTRIGALAYEAFHTLRALDRRRGLGRGLYAFSSLLLLGPVILMDATSQEAAGYGLRLAAIKRSDHGNAPKYEGEGGGLQIEWQTPERQQTPARVLP
ncbi:MAG: class I SAM-dependent methyltransferase [Ardenticatenales bacterium]|nr:class I SAM-dependent methyltransferase [Ardenticatenales bacterium]